MNSLLPIIIPIGILILISLKQINQYERGVMFTMGRFTGLKNAGWRIVIPVFQRMVKIDTRTKAVDVPDQEAITKDNITLSVDGVLYFRVVDPYKATYGVEDYAFAVKQLAQTTMRSELGKMELDKTFEERDLLNTNIVTAINQAAEPWGIQVLRYEIKDIVPPQSVMEAMEAQMKAERVKRAQILESEGDRQANINVAEGKKQAQVLGAEGEKAEQILRAEGEAKAIIAVAEAQADALRKVGEAADTEQGQKAIQLDLATKAIAAKEAIAKESSVVLLPDSATDASSLVAQGMSIINSLNQKQKL